MLVKTIEQRIKINKIVSISMIIASIIIVIAGFFFAYQLVQDSKKSIYVIDNGIPIMVEQTDVLLNRPVEYKAQVELFHRMFFTLPPDDIYIKKNLKASLYLIDDTGKNEYNSLREKGFYNQIISSNSTISIDPDSVIINIPSMSFRYYAKQYINRKTSLIIRNLITEGNFKDINRTDNNSHGVLLTNWKILDNSELSTQNKSNY